MKKIYFTDSDLLSAIADNPTYIPDNTKLYTFLSKLKISLALLNKLSNKEVRKILLSQAKLHIKNLKDTEKTKIWNGIHINQYWIKKNIYAKLEKKKVSKT